MYGSNEQGFDPSDVRLKKRKVEGAENWGVCFTVSFADVVPLKDIEAAVLLHSARSSVYVHLAWDSRCVVVCRFAHNQSGGKTSNGRDSNPKYLGVKKYGW